ncbi:hypothetical protein CVO74_07670 [Xanthomonas prunicola]|uniref:Uncharacterized protein n=1 Tax=Xanthomonas prunicola TaxID=2053930 RepID=A0A2N3RHX0_9XANT|nr:hypothetical protein XpruCFBP8353_14710 [Xanthomonas prunicola]PKV16372.1 hypothetical protein XpruCFBP8354_14695 [Xanthomonas prunicola]PKV23038.1 hypothetical protein CVO74_07670 [Xanthomonas prunicola]
MDDDVRAGLRSGARGTASTTVDAGTERAAGASRCAGGRATRSTSILPWRSALRRNAVRVDYAAIADPAALVKRLTEDVRARSSTTVISGWSAIPRGATTSLSTRSSGCRAMWVIQFMCSGIGRATRSRAFACAATAPDLLLRECCRSHGILLFHRR